MNTFSAKALAAAATALGLLCVAGSAIAQADYPNRPIKLVVGYVPGPGPDFAARNIAPKLAELLGQPVVVENKVGAGGTLATSFVASAQPDGYTLLVAEAAQLELAPYVFKSLPYNPLKDLTPISLITEGSGFVLVSSPKSRIHTIQDMVAEARKAPGKLTYGTAGIGSLHHLIMESFTAATGIQMQHIPYKGGGQSLPAFLGGEHDIWTGSLQSIWPHVRAGNATLLAVSAGTRLPVIADVPSLSEIVPGFAMESHTGLLGPANMPPGVVAKLSTALKTVLADPAIRTKLSAENSRTVRWTTGQEYQDMVRVNLKKYETASKQANIKPE
jgi:tripartite-type tricarboxylate transporter receptor subunit TctC